MGRYSLRLGMTWLGLTWLGRFGHFVFFHCLGEHIVVVSKLIYNLFTGFTGIKGYNPFTNYHGSQYDTHFPSHPSW